MAEFNFGIGGTSETVNGAELNSLPLLPPHSNVRRRDSNNGKRKSHKKPYRFFFNFFLGIDIFLLILALVGFSLALYSVIVSESRNDDFNLEREKLKKQEKLLNEQTQSQIAMEKELDILKKLVLSQQNLIQNLENKLEEIYNQVRYSFLSVLYFWTFFNLVQLDLKSLTSFQN